MAEQQKPETVQMYFDPLDAALVRSEDQQWIDTGTGNQFKVLRISKETGAWSALIKAAKGQVNSAHTHLGPVDFLSRRIGQGRRLYLRTGGRSSRGDVASGRYRVPRQRLWTGRVPRQGRQHRGHTRLARG
jgi:hypothetical protein